MITREELLYLKTIIGCAFSGDLQVCDKKGVYVKRQGTTAYIGGEEKIYAARALTLLSMQDGDFELQQPPHFKTCGVLLDMSRNAVMRVPAVKEYLTCMARLGMNMLMLYTEDTYSVKQYPYFGYRRGRYTREELREIDDYADSLGIEIVPCIQTLGHLEQFLRWEPSGELRDTAGVLLCESEKTYNFLDACIKSLRSCFRSKRIHIGMDEAFDVGLGQYLQKNGYKDRYTLLVKHLTRVTEICENYGFRPMMWSDMFYRLGSSTGEYYDPSVTIPKVDMPDVDMIYWDYYHTEEAFYDGMLKGHRQLEKPLLFGGGIWTWNMLLPDYNMTLETTLPAMRACLNNHVQEVFATVWGDDGQETNHFFSTTGLPVFSEFCYKGEDCTLQDIQQMLPAVSDFTYQDMMAFSAMHGGPADIGKAIFYTDILYNMPGLKDYSKYEKLYQQAYDALDSHTIYHDYAKRMLEILEIKCQVLSRLKPAYEARDMQYLNHLTQSLLPALLTNYQELAQVHETLWLSTNKAFGLEVLQGRYGFVTTRLDYAIRVLTRYHDGLIDRIEELDMDPIEVSRWDLHSFQAASATSKIW